MAERLSEFPFKPRRGRLVYPYDEWCDGAIWRVKRGVDYECKPASFVSALSYAAKRRNLNVVIGRRGDVVTFKFTPQVARDVDAGTGDAA